MYTAVRGWILVCLTHLAMCHSMRTPSPPRLPSPLTLPYSLLNCVEVDLAEIGELRLQLKNKLLLEDPQNTSHLLFGFLDEDWYRMQKLEIRLPEDSLLKNKLRRVFRLLIVAIYEAYGSTQPTRDSSDIYLEKEPITKIQVESFHTTTENSITSNASTSPGKVNYNSDPVGMYKNVNNSVSSTTDRLVAEGSDHDETALPNPNAIPNDQVSLFDLSTAHTDTNITYSVAETETNSSKTITMSSDSSTYKIPRVEVDMEESGLTDPSTSTALENSGTASVKNDFNFPKTNISVDTKDNDSYIYSSGSINTSPLVIIRTTQTSSIATMDNIMIPNTELDITTNQPSNYVNESIHEEKPNDDDTHTSQKITTDNDKAADGQNGSPIEYTTTSEYDVESNEEESGSNGSTNYTETGPSTTITTQLVTPDRSKYGKGMDRDQNTPLNNTAVSTEQYTVPSNPTAFNKNTDPPSNDLPNRPSDNSSEEIITNKPDKAVLHTSENKLDITDSVVITTLVTTHAKSDSTKPTISPETKQESSTHSYDRGRELVTAQPKETQNTFTIILPMHIKKPIRAPSTNILKTFLPDEVKSKIYNPNRKKGCWNKNNCVAVNYIEFHDYFDPEILELRSKR